MYTKEVNYEDFNGTKRSEKLYFNMNKPQLIKLLKERPTLTQELDTLAKRLSSNDEDPNLYVDFMSFLDDMIMLSYGKKTDDGRFIKNSTVLEEFQTSNAYEALYTDFLANPREFDAFISGIFPADIMTEAVKEQALKEAEKQVQKSGE